MKQHSKSNLRPRTIKISVESRTSSIKIKINLRNTTPRSHKNTKAKIISLRTIRIKPLEQLIIIMLHSNMVVIAESNRVATKPISYNRPAKANKFEHPPSNLVRIHGKLCYINRGPCSFAYNRKNWNLICPVCSASSCL